MAVTQVAGKSIARMTANSDVLTGTFYIYSYRQTGATGSTTTFTDGASHPYPTLEAAGDSALIMGEVTDLTITQLATGATVWVTIGGDGVAARPS